MSKRQELASHYNNTKAYIASMVGGVIFGCGATPEVKALAGNVLDIDKLNETSPNHAITLPLMALGLVVFGLSIKKRLGRQQAIEAYYNKDIWATFIRDTTLAGLDAYVASQRGDLEAEGKLLGIRRALETLNITPDMHQFGPDDPDADRKRQEMVRDPLAFAQWAAGQFIFMMDEGTPARNDGSGPIHELRKVLGADNPDNPQANQ